MDGARREAHSEMQRRNRAAALEVRRPRARPAPRPTSLSPRSSPHSPHLDRLYPPQRGGNISGEDEIRDVCADDRRAPVSGLTYRQLKVKIEYNKVRALTTFYACGHGGRPLAENCGASTGVECVARLENAARSILATRLSPAPTAPISGTRRCSSRARSRSTRGSKRARCSPLRRTTLTSRRR